MKKNPAKFAKYYLKNEPLLFEKKYGQKFQESLAPKKKFFLIMRAFLSTLFLPLAIFICYKFFGEEYIKVGMVVGFIGLFYGFYTSVFKMMGKSQEQWPAILAFINEKLPDTDLKLKNSNLSVAPLGVGYQLQVEGVFKGRQVKTEYKTAGSAAAKLAGASHMIMSGNFSTTMSLDKDVVIDMVESDPEFSEPYRRESSIKARDKKLTQSLTDLSVLPFYTLQGLIVHLEFLEQIAKKIEG